VEVVASLSQGRTAAARCGLFTHKSVPVIFEPPCNIEKPTRWNNNNLLISKISSTCFGQSFAHLKLWSVDHTWSTDHSLRNDVLEYMATGFKPYLGYVQANILHKIN